MYRCEKCGHLHSCQTSRDPRACTPAEIMGILNAPTGGIPTFPTDSLNEVFPGVYIGDADAAANIPHLRDLRITHVVNAAEGNAVGQIPSASSRYAAHHISYLGIQALDTNNFPLEDSFESTAEYIQNALDAQGRVLVHCQQGISRSAALVLAFLMIRVGESAQDAARRVRAQRAIHPNNGFLDQLCNLNERLVRARRFQNPD